MAAVETEMDGTLDAFPPEDEDEPEDCDCGGLGGFTSWPWGANGPDGTAELTTTSAFIPVMVIVVLATIDQ
jgi:hypothetical protein